MVNEDVEMEELLVLTRDPEECFLHCYALLQAGTFSAALGDNRTAEKYFYQMLLLYSSASFDSLAAKHDAELVEFVQKLWQDDMLRCMANDLCVGDLDAA